jgi:hypothetical protein
MELPLFRYPRYYNYFYMHYKVTTILMLGTAVLQVFGHGYYEKVVVLWYLCQNRYIFGYYVKIVVFL